MAPFSVSFSMICNLNIITRINRLTTTKVSVQFFWVGANSKNDINLKFNEVLVSTHPGSHWLWWFIYFLLTLKWWTNSQMVSSSCFVFCYVLTFVLCDLDNWPQAAIAETAQEEKKPETEEAKQEEEVDIDLNDPEVDKAASKIQAGFRGHQARKQVKAMKVGLGFFLKN